MEKLYDVTSLGESLIDFAMYGKSDQGNDVFEACPGGATYNALAMMNKLGRKTAYISKVGDDAFGRLLKKTLADGGTYTGNMVDDEEIHTTLSFINTLPDGDREFSFYRNPGADIRLSPEEVDYDLIRQSKDFHLGTLSMTTEPVRSATKKCLEVAKEAGCTITFDPNLRENLWDSLEDAKEQIEYVLPLCDLLKISDNEIQFVSGMEDYDDGIHYLQDKYNIPLIFLTMGKDGSRAYYKDLRVEHPGYKVHTIETTGAGDTFCGCVVDAFLSHGSGDYTEQELADILTFANAGAAIVTTRKGAARSMPNKDEIEALMNQK